MTITPDPAEVTDEAGVATAVDLIVDEGVDTEAGLGIEATEGTTEGREITLDVECEVTGLVVAVDTTDNTGGVTDGTETDDWMVVDQIYQVFL